MELIEPVSEAGQSNQRPETHLIIGGKAKPLKAPKKAPKAEMDDEDKAFAEKQRAGATPYSQHLTAIMLMLDQTQRQRQRWRKV